MTRKQKRSSWRNWYTFPKDFAYALDAPILDVVHTLTGLETPWGCLSPRSQDISVTPREGEYEFCIRLRRGSTVTAAAEVTIWENDEGIHIEGHSRLTAVFVMDVFLFLGMLFPLFIMFYLLAHYLFGFVLLTLIFGAFLGNAVNTWHDRQRAIRELEKVVEQVTRTHHPGKQKRSEDVSLESRPSV
jgi:hypothetical protein